MLAKLAEIFKKKKNIMKGIYVAAMFATMICLTPMLVYADGDKATSVEDVIKKMGSAPETNNLGDVTNVVTNTGIETLNLVKIAALILLAIAMIISFIKFGASGNQGTVGEGKSGFARAGAALMGVLCLMGIIALIASLATNISTSTKQKDDDKKTSSIEIVYELEA